MYSLWRSIRAKLSLIFELQSTLQFSENEIITKLNEFGELRTLLGKVSLVPEIEHYNDRLEFLILVVINDEAMGEFTGSIYTGISYIII